MKNLLFLINNFKNIKINFNCLYIYKKEIVKETETNNNRKITSQTEKLTS